MWSKLNKPWFIGNYISPNAEEWLWLGASCRRGYESPEKGLDIVIENHFKIKK